MSLSITPKPATPKPLDPPSIPELMPPSTTSLLEPDMRKPYDTWKSTPGPASNAAMLKHLEPTIQGAIRTHVGEPNPLLVSRARRMALEGLNSYDPMRGRLQTHLYNHLQGLKRVNRQQTQILKVPERIQLDHYQLGKMEEELTNELGREPTDGELTDRTGFSMKRLAALRRYSPAVAEGAMSDPETGAAFEGEAYDPRGEHDRAVLQAVYDELDPHHQKVMELALGLNGRRALPNDMIAAKMNRSPGAISQAKKRIQDIIDEMTENS